MVLAWWIERTAARSASGPIIVDPEHPQTFRHTSGERFFPMGDTAYYLAALPEEVIAHYLEVRRAHGFNFVRMMAVAEGFWPFGGTPDQPEYGVLNESALKKLDWIFDRAAERSIHIDLILWGYGVPGGEGLWSRPLDGEAWVRALVNRYKGRENLFMYTIANEFERYPDGKYEFAPSDVEWARRVARQIRDIDPVHPIGCHPSVWITDQDSSNKGPRPFASYRGYTQRRPQVVWALWDGSAINVNVTQNNEGVQPRNWGSLEGNRRGLTYYPIRWEGVDYSVQWTPYGWDFEAAGLEDCIAQDWTRGKPVLNSEFGYQYEPGYEQERDYSTRQVHHPSSVRRKAWKIATSGGCFAAGYQGTAVRHFTIGDVDNFRPQQLTTLHAFFTGKTEYWKMAPHPEAIASHNSLLASPGSEYVAYFPRGGTNHVQMLAGAYDAEWLHPESGKYFPKTTLELNDGAHEFTPPELPDHDWVLHLRRKDPRTSPSPR